MVTRGKPLSGAAGLGVISTMADSRRGHGGESQPLCPPVYSGDRRHHQTRAGAKGLKLLESDGQAGVRQASVSGPEHTTFHLRSQRSQ